MREGDAPRDVGPPRLPLSVLIPGVGLIGGAIGGVAIGVLWVIWSAIERGGQGVALPAIILGAAFGAVVGGTMGVVAGLLRLLVVGLGGGLAGELIAVSVGAVGAPLLLVSAYGLGPAAGVILVVLGALAALQFCRTVLKRTRQEAPEIGTY